MYRTLFCLVFLFSSIVYADNVRLMKTGDVALMQVHQDLSQASSTIDILTYIWDPCSIVGKMILEDLTDAVKRGVRVRILIDAFTHDPDLRHNFSAELGARGIELRYFNVSEIPNPMVNRRVHAKIIVVDGKHYYLGGRNVADDYFDMEQNNWSDRDLDVEGKSAKQAQRAFTMMWKSDMTTSENTGASATFKSWSDKCFKPSLRDQDLKNVIQNKSASILATQKTYACRSVKAVIDDPHFLDVTGDLNIPGQGMDDTQLQRKYTTRAAIEFISSAKSLSIENYTYVPEGHIADALNALRARRRKVEVYTNFNMDTGPLQFLKENSANADNVGSEKIYEISNKGSLSYAWEMTPAEKPPEWMIHTKAMVSGTSSKHMSNVLVGSFNLDPRSYGTNVESAVIVRGCPELAMDLKSFMDNLHKVYLADQSCAECKIKTVVSTEDQLEATVGRQLFWQRGK